MSTRKCPQFYSIMGDVASMFGGHFEDGILTFEDFMAPGDPDERPKHAIKVTQQPTGLPGWYLIAVDGVCLVPDAADIEKYIRRMYKVHSVYFDKSGTLRNPDGSRNIFDDVDK